LNVTVRVAVGVHVHSQPDRLRATLEYLRAHTSNAFDLLLLPDGPDGATFEEIERLAELPKSGTEEPRGAAACFNRLAGASDADVLVLLESGSLVGPGWLDHLLDALFAGPQNGLAGPSTNLAWNEQCVFPGAGGTREEISRSAGEAARRFAGGRRTLEPLYSLADFCYVVRREVVSAVGAADEGYGLGPCWEMDYNIRAARAGFRGIWAESAYVYRSPFTARRREEEARLFEASKRRYQDKFCALRLRGERHAYEPHCRGDCCEHFAPASLIRIAEPLPPPRPSRGRAAPAVAASSPLVSCVMPTHDRAEFALQAVRYFLRQDFPASELIVLDDGATHLSQRIPEDARIHYVRLPRRLSIGAKRNLGCELARGDFIAQWDDDDWYAPGRLRLQLAPLFAGRADISALTAGIFCDLPRWEFWCCSEELHRRMFFADVHGGTLVFRRSLWREGAGYPDCSLAEDAGFLQSCLRRGARLERMEGRGVFLYLRHAGNTWDFRCGSFLDPRGWQRESEPPLPREDRAFYAARSPAAPRVEEAAEASLVGENGPMVSCVMPTADRRRFVPQAIAYFTRQSYANRELLILDDGSNGVADLVPADPRIRYVRLPARHSLGAKRNLGCNLARGEIIVHWDDDDWMSPSRLSHQVRELLAHPKAELCGLSRLYFFEPASRSAWSYAYPARERRWVAGATFCYRKSLLERFRFPDVNEGEDTRFVWGLSEEAVLPLEREDLYVAMIHARNTSRKRPGDSRWRALPVEVVERLMQGDAAFYRSLE
jgi:glycosyltransferase involved in cell wall biosynthesis